MQGAVQAAGGDQVLVAPVGGDAPLRQHDDPVGVADGGEAVGDDEAGAAAPSKSAKERWISRSVAVSSAEVASSRMRIGGSFRKMRAMDSRCFWPPDSLTPRSPTTVSSPSRQGGQHVAKPGAAGRVLDLRRRGFEPAVGDVVADRAAEQEHVLLHDADLAAQGGEAHGAQVDAVDW